MNNDLFSPNLERRLAATNAAIAANLDLERTWPAGCRGAPNAYVIFLGPSPGAPDKGNSQELGGANRSMERNSAKIGEGFGLYEFVDGKQRNWKWRRLFATIVGDGEAYKKLTGVWNLDWGNFANEKLIAQSDLVAGSKMVLQLVSEAKPRVIITLTKSVADVFGCMVRQNGFPYSVIEPPDEIGRPAYEVDFPGAGFRTLVFKTPRHPSRIPLSVLQQQAIRNLVERYK